MQLKNFQVYYVDSDQKWDDDDSASGKKAFVSVIGFDCNVTAEADDGTHLDNIRITPTAEEQADFLALVKKIEDRLNRE